jgi:ABC-type multidrug transport system fused ATPase/permease subunit
MNLRQIFRNLFITLNNRERWQMLKLALLDVLVSVLDIAFLMALLLMLDVYMRGSSDKMPPAFSNRPLVLIVSFFVLFAIKNLFGFLVTKKQYTFVYDVASRRSKSNLEHFLNGPFSEQVDVNSAVLTRKIMQQPIEFAHYVVNGFQQIFGQVVLVIITLVAVCYLNPLLLLLLIVLFVPPLLFVSKFMKRKLQEGRRYEKVAGERAMQHLREALSGFVESNLYAKTDFFSERYHRYQQQLNGYLSQRLAIQSVPSRMMEVFAIFALLLLVLVSQLMTNTTLVSVSSIGALMVAAYKIIPGVVKVANAVSQVKSYGFATVGLAVKTEATVADKSFDETIQSISFENVVFQYPAKKVLDSFSMTMKRGDLLVMMGKSGLGKTTILNLLLGFMAPRSGVIMVNGKHDFKKDICGFRLRVAYVRQQSFMLHASIKENIALAEKVFDDKRLQAVAKVTGVDKIAQSLNEVVTEDGKNFSGGERQRIALARALYRDFDLLILDEPFNELDESSERQLLRELRRIADEGKMILLVTHSPAALEYCNKKILLDD